MTKKEKQQRLKEIGEAVREARILKGYSLKHVATEIGSHLARVRAIEQGKTYNIATLIKLCALFELKVKIIKL